MAKAKDKDFPQIESVTPDSGSVGDKVAIKGKHFNGTANVTFGGVTTEFKVDSDEQITATVPKMASPGNINIKVIKPSGQQKHKFQLIAAQTSQTLLEKESALVPAAPVSTQTTAAVSSNAKPRDLDRRRAAVAWQHIQVVKPESYQAKYGSLARKLPTLIQVNGLAQTLAFLKAKGKENNPKSRKEHFVQAFYHLSNWLCSRFCWNDTDLLTKVLAQNMDSQQYRLATSEALAFLNWLKRFAEAELGFEEEA